MSLSLDVEVILAVDLQHRTALASDVESDDVISREKEDDLERRFKLLNHELRNCLSIEGQREHSLHTFTAVPRLSLIDCEMNVGFQPD